jgi:hypothetical protein
MREYNGYIVTRSVLTYIGINIKLCIQSAKCSDNDKPDTMWWSLMLLIDDDLPLSNPTMNSKGNERKSRQKAHASAGAWDNTTNTLAELMDTHITRIEKNSNKFSLERFMFQPAYILLSLGKPIISINSERANIVSTVINTRMFLLDSSRSLIMGCFS